MTDAKRLAELDHQHVWHPFTPMKQWREQPPLIIERAEGFHLIDTDGRRYIDGVSSLWCNVHGHRVPEIDQAIRDQLDQVAHTTLLGLASPPSIELAARLCDTVNTSLRPPTPNPQSPTPKLTKVFYSDAGATAVEVAFKMAVGYWHHTGHPEKNKFIGLAGAYHGDTTGSMSVGYSELFHKPFVSMVFDVTNFPAPHHSNLPPNPKPGHAAKPLGRGAQSVFPSQDDELCEAAMSHSLANLETLLKSQAHQTAAVVIEPVMQGAAGMVCQPPGFVKAVRELCDQHDVLLIADEVATGFARTGQMFACAHDHVTPDIMCLAKGITAGYLPLAATLTTDRVEQAFTGEPDQRPPKTLYHGHTYTGNPLACAAALASLDRFEQQNTLGHAKQSAALIADRLTALNNHPNVTDIRQRGLMVGIELGKRNLSDGGTAKSSGGDFSARTGAKLCNEMRNHGLLIRPLGDTLVLMPAPAMDHDTLNQMLDIVVDTLTAWQFPD